MSRHLASAIAVSLLTIFSAHPLNAADPPSAAEARLRDSLKNTMLQLRSAQTELATAQAAAIEKDKKIKELEESVKKMGAQLVDDKKVADGKIEGLSTKLTEKEIEASQLKRELEKWTAEHKKITEIAQTKEGQRAKLADDVLVLQRQVADQRMKNAAMFQIGNEILTRYEKFGLGTAITAREPFVGITRVKLQNLVQDYGDKLADQRIPPVPAPPPGEQKKQPASKPPKTTAPQPKPADSSSAPAGRTSPKPEPSRAKD